MHLPLSTVLAAAACSASLLAQPLPPCEWCGTGEAPPNLTHVMTIAGDDEPGERIILRGRVFQTDGVTPAPGVVIYAYHTDETGVYRREGGETGNARRHGVLRGWLRTDSEGRYEIRTIKPAPYPSRNGPAHVHLTLQPPNGEEFWIDSTVFAGDPLITDRQRREDARDGAFGAIVDLSPGEDGVPVGVRDIRLRG